MRLLSERAFTFGRGAILARLRYPLLHIYARLPDCPEFPEFPADHAMPSSRRIPRYLRIIGDFTPKMHNHQRVSPHSSALRLFQTIAGVFSTAAWTRLSSPFPLDDVWTKNSETP